MKARIKIDFSKNFQILTTATAKENPAVDESYKIE